jgi:hypothetical protein
MSKRHSFGTVQWPTHADFRGRLEAIGLGRWASLYSGAWRSKEAGGLAGWWRP